jgi:hypothetical protein
MPNDPNLIDLKKYARIGKYDVVSHVATGGVCAVYKAIDTELGREVALKVLPPSVAENADALERFRREARHAARLRHENIVTLYDFGEWSGAYFLAMEFVAGIDLLTYITDEGPLEPNEALAILMQAARALDHLHKFGLVHRDIKPGNFLLAKRPDGWQVKLTDLGLARLRSDEEYRITRAGFTVGTLDYMSPEQARDSGSVDIRSDIYSLGCSWYHMLAGRTPFGEGSLGERLLRHFEMAPPDIRQFNPKVSPATVAVLSRMLAKKPTERYQTPALLMADLERLEQWNARPTAGAAAALAEGGKAGMSTADPLIDSAVEPTEEEPFVELLPVGLRHISPEQRQAAAEQYERARGVIGSGDLDYAIHLLLDCCKNDPSNLIYRRVLRRAVRAKFMGKNKAGLIASLGTSIRKTRLKAAIMTRDHVHVLEQGEEILSRNPFDIAVQLDMAQSAEALGAVDLALWLLRHAYDKDSPQIRVVRALAKLYEKTGRLKEAITAWDMVRKADPLDQEALRKPNELAASETIARGDYNKETRKQD